MERIGYCKGVSVEMKDIEIKANFPNLIHHTHKDSTPTIISPFPEGNTIMFMCEEVNIRNGKLTLSLKEWFADEKIDTLVFKVGNKEYEFRRKQ